MKVTNLKIGNTYYMQAKYQPTNYTSGVLLEILDGNKVLMQGKNGNTFRSNARKLHNRPDKAVIGKRAQDRVRGEMKAKKEHEKQKEIESLIPKSLQKQIKKLKSGVFGTVENGLYVIKGYIASLQFCTLDEMKEWVEQEINEYQHFKQAVIYPQYKYLKDIDKNGNCLFYTKLSFDFPHRKIRCKKFVGDINVIPVEKILDSKQIPKNIEIEVVDKEN